MRTKYIVNFRGGPLSRDRSASARVLNSFSSVSGKDKNQKLRVNYFTIDIRNLNDRKATEKEKIES